MVLLITKCLSVRETNVRFTQWSTAGAYQVNDVTSFFRVGLLTFLAGLGGDAFLSHDL